MDGFGPLRWRALVLVLCPRTGRPPRGPGAPVGPDVYEPPDVLVDLAPEVSLDLQVLVHVGPYGADLALGQVPDLRVRIHAGLGEDLPRGRTADPVDVGEADLDPLLPGQVYTGYPRHLSPASACGGGSYRSPARPH